MIDDGRVHRDELAYPISKDKVPLLYDRYSPIFNKLAIDDAKKKAALTANYSTLLRSTAAISSYRQLYSPYLEYLYAQQQLTSAYRPMYPPKISIPIRLVADRSTSSSSISSALVGVP